MKSTGVTRKIEELGRIVLPKELRRTLGIAEKDPIEIFVEDEKIILQKYNFSYYLNFFDTKNSVIGTITREAHKAK
ncbi:AbrB/MazE/SpoVT family DNA-binding domain-containing protein [Bacillus cereus]|uniref:AbrB/MazE/SpoVT family DNA-binding domain-containing protein n=1 Tax=Bacillus cereus TaxID=1396 RepID=UPI00311AAFEE